MNSKCLELCKNLVDPNFIQLSSNSLKTREKELENLLTQRRLPDVGWDDLQVEWVLSVFAAMDSNNFPNNVGAGEREGRVYSTIVKKRNFGLSHGIGRSGDVAATQPKAAGSSLICKLAKYLVKDTMKLSGYKHIEDLILLPLATGMSLSMCFLAIKQKKVSAKFVLLSRIDQKTCLKCIATAGLSPIVLEPELKENSYLECNYLQLEEKIKEIGSEEIACVMAITSCFSPRAPDNVQKIAELCKKYDIACVINNAYGVQCSSIANSIENGILRGRIDYVVQSMDKNFMVPVGGAIVFSPSKTNIQAISSLYPGRATAGPTLDLFITLLQMGRKGYQDLLRERVECFSLLQEKLQDFSQRNGMKLILNPKNRISFAISFEGSFSRKESLKDEEEKCETNDSFLTSNSLGHWNNFGGMLYNAGISGARVVTDSPKTICGIEFKNYGSHSNQYPHLPYFNVAAAIGVKEKDINLLIRKLEENFSDFKKKLQILK